MVPDYVVGAKELLQAAITLCVHGCLCLCARKEQRPQPAMMIYYMNEYCTSSLTSHSKISIERGVVWCRNECAVSFVCQSQKDVFQNHAAAGRNKKVLLVDDLLATGGTAAAAVRLLDRLEAEIVSVSFLIELSFLEGRAKLGEHSISSILSY